jgi:hypothetical protein
MAKTLMSNTEILETALVGLQYQLSQIDEKVLALRRRFGVRALRNMDGSASVDSHVIAERKRPTMSAAGRRRIAAAQRKRWAALKNAKAPIVQTPKLSAAARKKISGASKKRWAGLRKKNAA